MDPAGELPVEGLAGGAIADHRRAALRGLEIDGLVGDIAHSRTARSNIHGLLKLGARVIVCSSQVQDEIIHRCLAGGAAAFIGKPFQAEDVLRTLERVLE